MMRMNTRRKKKPIADIAAPNLAYTSAQVPDNGHGIRKVLSRHRKGTVWPGSSSAGGLRIFSPGISDTRGDH